MPSEKVRKVSNALGGLSAVAVVFMYVNFAQTKDVQKLETWCREQNRLQWAEINELKRDAAANDAIIKYYFQPVARTNFP